MGVFAFIGFVVWSLLMVLIFRKAGYSGLQMILVFIPVVNVFVFVWFALTEWPIQKELRLLREREAGAGGATTSQGGG